MSAVPPSPSRPDPCSSPSLISAVDRPACSASQSTRPGSTAPRAGRHHQALERREAHRRVDRSAARGRPPATRRRRGGRSRPAGPRSRRPGAPPPAARRTRGTARGTRTAGSASAPARRPAARTSRPPAGWSAWNAVSKQATAGTPGSSRPTTSSAASDAGWWSGARSTSERIPSTTDASTSVRAREARAAMHDPMPDGVDRPEIRDRVREVTLVAVERTEVDRPDQDVVPVEDPQLEAARARVDDEDPVGAGHAGRVTRRWARPSPRPRAGPRPPGACTPGPRGACRPSPGARARPSGRAPAPGR